ncbi:MAG: hypothetical protein OZSIB_2247 [Candidatus Ozemobacter sibiricus]|uniref:Uncharacterized protein n=1 Tax=Candidatus Ozemobacter sibiricus TaxID=2268124 RepID=A0A367ZTB5_9BACT|nr:MAG: hypothetical protein OZSIB_2247 [Candidatus Ozemobacter sibiricus]
MIPHRRAPSAKQATGAPLTRHARPEGGWIGRAAVRNPRGRVP